MTPCWTVWTYDGLYWTPTHFDDEKDADVYGRSFANSPWVDKVFKTWITHVFKNNNPFGDDEE